MSLKEYSAADGAHIDSSPSFDPAGAEQRPEAKRRSEGNRRLLAEVRAAAAKEPRSGFDLQLVARAMFEHLDYELRDVVQELHAEAGDVRERIETMGPDDLALLLLDMAMVNGVEISGYELGSQPEILLAAAAHYGVQVGLGTVTASDDDQDDDEGEPA